MEEIIELIQEYSYEQHLMLNNPKLLAQTRPDENGVFWAIFDYWGVCYKVKNLKVNLETNT